MRGHLTDDVIGHALFAKSIARAPPIALQGCCEGCIEPDGHTGNAQLPGQIDRIRAVPPLIVGGVEDDGAIGLQMSVGAALYFGKDRIPIVWIFAAGLKLGTHLIRSDDNRTEPIGISRLQVEMRVEQRMISDMPEPVLVGRIVPQGVWTFLDGLFQPCGRAGTEIDLPGFFRAPDCQRPMLLQRPIMCQPVADVVYC